MSWPLDLNTTGSTLQPLTHVFVPVPFRIGIFSYCGTVAASHSVGARATGPPGRRPWIGVRPSHARARAAAGSESEPDSKKCAAAIMMGIDGVQATQ